MLAKSYEGFDAEIIYARVEAHEMLCVVIAVTAANNLILQAADVSNTWLHGKLDFPILMEQATN